MRILSLFDGMACGMIAMLQVLGGSSSIERYVAFEYDEKYANPKKGRPFGYAALTASHNFPNIEQRGNVIGADFTEFKGFDWVLAGFPCTTFSICKTKDRETSPYSGLGWELFSEAWRAIQEVKPKYFLLENNESMAPAVQKEISKIIGFEPLHIDSALVSAQSRRRIYWVGVRNEDGAYRSVPNLQPQNLGVRLCDVLDDYTDRDKARAVIGSAGRTTYREYFYKHQGNMAFEPVRVPDYHVDKSRPITASYANKGDGAGSLATEAFPSNPKKQRFDYIAVPIDTKELL